MKYYFFMFLAFLSRILPRPAVVCIARFLGILAYCCLPKKRAVVRHNLALLDTPGSAAVKKIFQNFFTCFADFCRFSRITREQLDRLITDNRIGEIQKALGRGKGLLALTAHVGHWELGAIILALYGYRTHALYHAYTDPSTAGFFNTIRHPAIDWIQAGKGAKETLRILKNKEIIATAIDINFFGGGIHVSFLGKPKLFPTGPALFSYHTGTPIVTAYVLLEKDGKKYRTIIDKPIIPDQNAPKTDEIRRLTAAIVKNYEHIINQYPEQWFMFQPVHGA